jgi:hypothetical protein
MRAFAVEPAVFFGEAVVHFTESDQTFDKSEQTYDPNGAKVEALLEGNSAVFGLGGIIVDYQVINDKITFNDWAIKGFGNGTTLSATSNESQANAAIFGTGWAKDNWEFKNWRIGNFEGDTPVEAFGDDAQLTATATTTGGQGNAVVFGAGWANNSSNFENWKISGFGPTAKLTATAGGNSQANAAVFGTGWAVENSNFNGWTIGNFGATTELTAIATATNGQANAAVFGTGWANKSQFNNWEIKGFGNETRLTTTAIGNQTNAAVFGTGWANPSAVFNGWRIGNFEGDTSLEAFGNDATLTVTAISGDSQANVAAFGAGLANDNSNFENWKIGNFGTTAILTAEATSNSQANAIIFGAGWARPNTIFNGWRIGNFAGDTPLEAFGDDAQLTAIATGNQTNVAVCGTGWANYGSNFENWKIGGFGTTATLAAEATSNNQANAAIFGTGWANPSSNFNGWSIGNFGGDTPKAFGDDAKLTVTATATNGQANAAVFGTGWANDNSDFENWKIGGFGSGARLNATATGDNQVNAAVFGTGWTNNSVIFNGWKIGNFEGDTSKAFGDDAQLTATAASGGGQANAAVFGTGWANNSSSATNNSNFENWKIGNFGTTATLTAEATGGRGNAVVFGTGWADSNSNFKSWEIGNFGYDAKLTAKASGADDVNSSQVNAAVFGTGWAYNNSNFENWKIGNFGTTATLIATATATASGTGNQINAYGSQALATVFGTGWAYDNSNFKSWEIGNFGDSITLVATATASSSGTGPIDDSQALAAVFGAGWANNSLNANNHSDFYGWKIGNFGDNATLVATATATAVNGRSQAFVSVFGVGWGTNPSSNTLNFSNWTIGNFGKNLTALSHTRDYSSVFGAGWLTNDHTTISDWTIGDIGDNSTLFSSSFCSTVFGSARLNDLASSNNWTIGNIGTNATFISYSSNDDSTYPADHDPDLQLHYGSFGSVFGTAFNEGMGNNPNNWSVEFQGDALCSSIGFNGGGINNIHLGTLGGDKSDNFRFYFNATGAQATDPVVTIAALKLSGPIGIANGKAELILSSKQGQGNAADYARAIALGPNFQLSVGRSRIMGEDFRETEASIANGGEAKGGAGVMNIFGAIGKARFCFDVQDSVMRVYSGWTVNAYGPAEDLRAIDVEDKAVFNTYENLRNVTFVNGTTNARGTSDGIGIITFNGGNLRIAKNNNGSGFNGAMDNLKSQMAYVVPSSSPEDPTPTVYKGPDGIEIDSSAYPWKGAAPSGQLILKEGDRLVFHVDSSRHLDSSDIDIPTMGDNDTFEFVNGRILIEEGVADAIVFEGGKLAIINDDPDNPGFLPAHSDFLIARMVPQQQPQMRLLRAAPAPESEESTNNSLPIPVKGIEVGTTVDLTEGTFHEVANTSTVLSKEVTPGYTEWNSDLGLFIHESENGTALYIGSGENPRRSVPTALALRQANVELANMSIGSISLLRHTVTNRLTDLKGNGNDPFLAIADGHFHQDVTGGFGYNGELHGIAGGVDGKCKLANGYYLGIGVAFGFFDGHTNFYGVASSKGKNTKHTIYSGAIFTTYESFGKNNLKTNANLFVGIGHSKDKLHREDAAGHGFCGDMRSNTQFAKLEIIKNLLSLGGMQIGPWLFVDYNRVSQGSYGESYDKEEGYGKALSRVVAHYGAQTVSKVKHNFLDTIIGFNLEKEIQDKVNFDNGLRLFLKAGWCRQLLRKHSHAAVSFDVPDLRDIDTYSPTFAYPKESSLVFVAGFRKKLSQHWKISGHWRGVFSKNAHQNLCSIFLGYDF